MKKTKLTKLMALTLTGVMALSPMTVFAEDGETASANITGEGKVEDVISKKVEKVVFPTTGIDTAFDFTLDPQGLLAATDSTNYSSSYNVYFANAGEGSTTYTNKSDKLTVINKSSYAVDVSLAVTVSKLVAEDNSYAVVMTDDNTFASDASTSLYLGLTTTPKSGSAATKALTTDGINVSVPLASGEAQYEITKDGDEYKYDVKSTAADTDFDSFTFNLEAACNKNADWMAAKDATPQVELVWSVAEQVTATVDATGLVTLSGLTGTRNIDAAALSIKGDGTVTQDTNTYSVTASELTFDLTDWTDADGGSLKFTIGANQWSYFLGDTVTVTIGLTDGSSVTATVAVPAA